MNSKNNNNNNNNNSNNTTSWQQIMMDDLSINYSSSLTSNNHDFIDFMNRSPSDIKKDAGPPLVPSYDFMPTKTITNYDSLDGADELAKFALGKNQKPANTSLDASLVSEIDKTMKKYTDNLMHAIDGLSARVSQLETKTRGLENSVDDLKVSLGNNHGSSDGKMRQVENILREVLTGVNMIKDKQEVLEAQLLIAKLQMPKVEQNVESRKTPYSDSTQQQQLPTISLPQPPPHLHAPNAPPPPPPHQLPNQFPQNPPPGQNSENLNLPYQIPLPHHHHPPPNAPPSPRPYQLSNQFPQNPPPGQTPEHLNAQYQTPPPHQHHPPPPPPQNQYQPPPSPQPHPSFSSLNPSPSPQIYPPHSSQQSYGPTQNLYDPPSGKPGPGYSVPFGPTPGHEEPYPYSSGGPMKPHQIPSSPAIGQSGGSGYPNLPTARILPNAPPTGGGSGSSGPGNRVPIDDVVDKVTNMGFPREQVRATVRKLTENGQAVDLNIVLDKLMNDGQGRVWFGE